MHMRDVIVYPVHPITQYSTQLATSSIMSAKLGSVPIVECAASIRSLATDAHNTHRNLAEIQRHILRTSDPLRPSDLSSAWRTYTEVSHSIDLLFWLLYLTFALVCRLM